MACAAKRTIPLTSSDQSITPYLSIAPLRQHHYRSHCHQRRLFASRLSLSRLCSYQLIVSSRYIGSPLLRQAITCEQIFQGVTLLLRRISGNSIADQAVVLKAYFPIGESLVNPKTSSRTERTTVDVYQHLILLQLQDTDSQKEPTPGSSRGMLTITLHVIIIIIVCH